MNSQLNVFNSLSGQKDVFRPMTPPHVGLYVCGPTVYSKVHLGNCRTFISFDLIYRYLQHLGYKVRYVRNITDAGHLENDADQGEDRISKKARLEKIEPMEVVPLPLMVPILTVQFSLIIFPSPMISSVGSSE